jgi:DNA-binding CsgD family transcriptional regulator
MNALSVVRKLDAYTGFEPVIEAVPQYGSIANILGDMRRASTVVSAESALDAVANVLDMPFAYWSPDTSSPYRLSQMDAYAQARGWPAELLDLWWKKLAALKMPFYIRCRFEHLPFIVSLDRKRPRNASRMIPEEVQITALVREMGVRTMLVVPLHLSKGRVGMVMWAGSRSPSPLLDTLGNLEGDLLATGYHFMKIVDKSTGDAADWGDEHSRLTPREWDCARTLAQGYREAEIADLIGIKQVTVRFHLDNIVHKFGCKTRTQAVALLAQLGLLGPIGT